jgi:leucyl aminopeptidase (aminopeptidase T)
MLPVFPPELLQGARNCAIEYGGIKTGDQVVILTELGTYVDPMVVQALATVCQEVGAEVQTIFTRRLLNSWWEELSPSVRAAIGAADVVLQNMDTIGKTHLLDLMLNKKTRRIRNFATDQVLMSSDWARWPVELQDLVEIMVNGRLAESKSYRITTSTGTDIQGDISKSIRAWRKDNKRSHGMNVSFPPSVFRAMESLEANGIIAVEGTYPWGARRYGLPETYFDAPVCLTVERNKVIQVQGGWEADRYRAAIDESAAQIGERAFEVDSWHSGLSPRAFTSFAPKVDPDRWDHVMHNHENWFHFHIGGLSIKDTSDGKMHQKVEHINAVCRNATVYLDGEIMAKNGRLWIWDDPEVIAVAKKYGDPKTLFTPRQVWV